MLRQGQQDIQWVPRVCPPRNAHWGVVDPDLRLKQAKGIRVVDASVLVKFFILFVVFPGVLIRREF